MPTDRRNIVLYNVLRTGMLLSLFTMIIGLVAFLIFGGNDEAISPERLLNELVALNPVAIVELGLLFLIATPLVRVIATSIIFSYEKDLRYVLISVLVLLVITVAVFIEV